MKKPVCEKRKVENFSTFAAKYGVFDNAVNKKTISHAHLRITIAPRHF